MVFSPAYVLVLPFAEVLVCIDDVYTCLMYKNTEYVGSSSKRSEMFSYKVVCALS